MDYVMERSYWKGDGSQESGGSGVKEAGREIRLTLVSGRVGKEAMVEGVEEGRGVGRGGWSMATSSEILWLKKSTKLEVTVRWGRGSERC